MQKKPAADATGMEWAAVWILKRADGLAARAIGRWASRSFDRQQASALGAPGLRAGH